MQNHEAVGECNDASASGIGTAPGHRPIFIVGVDRSGTTLLSLMLDTHSRIAIPYESHFFVPYYKDRATLGDLGREADRRALVERILEERYVIRWDYRPDPGEIDLEKCDSLGGTIAQVYSAYARHFGKDIWGDKTPSYVTEVHILNRLFPDSRFIHIVRDGRDVALSIMKQRWGAEDFVTALEYWTRTVTIAHKMLAMLPPERSLELKFEDLVSDAPRELSRITDFLGVGFEEEMAREYSRRAPDKVGDRIDRHHTHLRGLPSAAQASKWRRSLGPADQAIAYKIAGPVLVELGYPAGVQRHPLRLVRKMYHRLYESYAWRLGKRIRSR